MKKSAKKKKKKKAKSTKRSRAPKKKAPRQLPAPEPVRVYELREAPVISTNFETEELLNRARMQWQFGDWDSLGKLDLLHIEHHPARAEMALLVGCASLQMGERDKGAAFLTSAIKWGADSRSIFRLVVSGVYNTLGRYSVLIGDHEKGHRFLQLACSGLAGDPELIGQARRQREWATLPGFQMEKTAGRPPTRDRSHKEALSNVPAKVDENFLTEALAEATKDSAPSSYPGIRSYAQNFEDVMLWRALHDIKDGFYIDLGAQHPSIDSVSKAFYEQGWRGIHVEPVHSFAQLLREDRPDETVIEAAVACEHGSMTFYEIPETGISTGDPAIANLQLGRGFPIIEKTVPTITLADIFALAGDREIHWLKIDVEGMEKDVLMSWGDAPQRPWLVMVESTLPNSMIETTGLWEVYLREREYALVYFDGLNRFYLSKEHASYTKVFATPPNVYDGFRLREAPKVG